MSTKHPRERNLFIIRVIRVIRGSFSGLPCFHVYYCVGRAAPETGALRRFGDLRLAVSHRLRVSGSSVSDGDKFGAD